MRRTLILVEGQTEERFVKDVLREHFWSLNLDLAPTILVTKQVKDGPNFKGGVTSFRSFEEISKGSSEPEAAHSLQRCSITTDFPPTFPG